MHAYDAKPSGVTGCEKKIIGQTPDGGRGVAPSVAVYGWSMSSLDADPAARVSLMVKPVGAACNLSCEYCYYLPTRDALYGGRTRRMETAALESLLRDFLPRAGGDVLVAWQGGEPTLAGLDFFRAALELQAQYRRPGQRIAHALQTNGTLIDDAWGAFLHEHGFLVGISIDGPRSLHDRYRRDAAGRPSHAAVLRGLRTLRRHRVEHNVLCVVNDATVQYPKQVWSNLVALGVRWVQFIPAIEWCATDRGPELAAFSPSAEAYGRFLCDVFDAWFERDRHRVSVRFFDSLLHTIVHGHPTECTYAARCPAHLTVEHNGDVFGCDHFVTRRWQLGTLDTNGGVAAPLTIRGAPPIGWPDRVDWSRLDAFAERKANLPAACEACPWRPLCHGGCPKHRPHRGDAAEPTVLCGAYRAFFAHAHLRLMWLAEHLRRGVRPPSP